MLQSVQHQTSNLPPYAPVMFLSTVMLPNVMLPLFIFEQRYRAMLAHCLEQNRMFCVALMKPGVTEAAGADDFFPVAGIGLLRACVGHPDGTSHLILQGLSRVKLRSFVQEQPFRIAELCELSTVPVPGPRAEEMSERLRRACAEYFPGGSAEREKLMEQIAQISDPGILCDVVAHTFLRDPFHQQDVLEQLEVPARLEILLRHLAEEA
jgi:ATP-dependent Lon protease